MDEQTDTFRATILFLLAEMRAGQVWVGWHETGVMSWGDLDDPIPDGVEVLDPLDDEIPLFAGAMGMHLIDAARRQQDVTLASSPDWGNREQRRARHKRR